MSACIWDECVLALLRFGERSEEVDSEAPAENWAVKRFWIDCCLASGGAGGVAAAAAAADVEGRLRFRAGRCGGDDDGERSAPAAWEDDDGRIGRYKTKCNCDGCSY
jgi:hypothetical protein